MLLYYFYNMAQVIRKYDWGGNIDYAPVKIYGTYYDPVEFDKEVSRRAQEYAQNGNYSGEKWQKFQSSVEAMKKGLMNGTVTMTGDGKFTGASLNSIWDEDAGRFFYKNLVDNGFKSIHTEPQKYNLMDSFTTYVDDTYGNNWDELDAFDEETGLRGTTNRSTEFKKWLNAEKNKLNSDISYRRNYSYKGTDSDVANWATRHNLTVQDINNILYALEDNTISDEENKTLPIGLNLNQFLSTGKDSEYHRTFIANQEAKAKQVKQEQQAKRIANNVFTPRFYGETPSTFSWDGTDYTMENISQLTDPEALKTLQYFYDQLHNTYSSGVLPTGLDYKYSVNLNNAFPSIMDNEYSLIKTWNDHPAYMDKGSFYIVRPNGNYIPVSNIYEDNGSYWADITNEDGSIQSLSLGAYTNPTAAYTSFIYNPESYKGKYVISKVLYDDKGEFYEIINTETKQKQTYRPKGESMEVGTYIFDDDELNKKVKKAQHGTVITFNDLNTTEPSPTTYQASLPSAGFTDKSNQHEEFMSGQELRGSDYARLGASIADLVSVIGAVTPAHWLSSIVGVGSSLTEFGADLADLNRPGAQNFWQSVGELGLNLGMDAVSLIPGGKALKASKIIKNAATWVPTIAGLIQSGYIVFDEDQRKDMVSTLNKITKGEISSFNAKDINNLTFIARSLIGGYKVGKGFHKGESSIKTDVDDINAKVIDKEGNEIGSVATSTNRKDYGRFNQNSKKVKGKALEDKYKKDLHDKYTSEVEASLQKQEGETDAYFASRKATEIENRVNTELNKKDKFIITTTPRKTTLVEDYTPGGNNFFLSDSWFSKHVRPIRRHYYGDNSEVITNKQGGVIRKYQNSGQLPFSLIYDPKKVYEDYINIEYPKDKAYDRVVGTSLFSQDNITSVNNDQKQITPTPGKDRYTFNPDMPTAYRLASLATNIFGNIAQTRKLIDNYKPFTRQAVQLPHVPVTGDYVSLQAGQIQAGNIRTAAKNASQSTSDARLGIASELTGNTQAVTPVMQATAADIAARKQSQAISQDVTNKNLISAVETANQNAFEYNKAHNYKTQLESQLIGLTAKNTDNFLKEMQMKSEQIDAMMKETEYKRRATDLSKTFENDLTKYANDNYLAKAKQYLTSKGTDISGMSNSSILDEYFKNNTLAYEEYQNYVNSQKNLFNSQLNNLQLEIYKGKPLLTVEDFLNTDKHENPIYGNPRRIFKKGGSVREKAVIQQIKDRNKDKLETKKSNAKSLRDSDREFNKTYRHLSAGTLALLKKAME